MKTNHRRGFVDPGSRRVPPEYAIFCRLTGAFAVAYDAPYNGHQGVRRYHKAQCRKEAT